MSMERMPWLTTRQRRIDAMIPMTAVKAPTRWADFGRDDMAQRLADRLTVYWHKLGFPLARFWIEDHHTIKSNLINGVPPTTAAEAKRREM